MRSFVDYLAGMAVFGASFAFVCVILQFVFKEFLKIAKTKRDKPALIRSLTQVGPVLEP